MQEHQLDLFADPFSDPSPPVIPSWLRNGGNHCATCAYWSKDKISEYVGLCYSPVSTDSGDMTDSRYRCQSFVRKEGT